MSRAIELKSESEPARFDFPVEIKLASGEDAPGTIEGYGSVFNLLDRGGDIVLPGAFKKSLAEWRKRKSSPAMLWQHDSRCPIGMWTDIAEDEHGLRVKGELVLDVPQAKATHALLKAGAIKSLSIGYQTQEAEIDRTTGARRLKRVDIWEISLVTFPMMPEAQILGVKNFDAPHWEKAFREGGLSTREAKLATSIARKLALREGERPEPAPRDGARDVLMTVRKAIEKVGGAA